MEPFLESFLLLLVLFNPFILSVYLIELVRELEAEAFRRHLVKAGGIAYLVFLVFAWAGEPLFQDVLQIRFESFLIFGGITFLIIGIRLIQGGAAPVGGFQSDSDSISAAIAMPLLVGPGTISASVLAGTRLELPMAATAIALALGLGLGLVVLFKHLHDYVRTRNEPLVHRYVHIAGRATALFTGSFAIEMILNGIEGWRQALG